MKLKKLSAKRIKNQVAGIVTNPYNVIILLTLCMLFLLHDVCLCCFSDDYHNQKNKEHDNDCNTND